jgi:hypothetical protein
MHGSTSSMDSHNENEYHEHLHAIAITIATSSESRLKPTLVELILAVTAYTKLTPFAHCRVY